MNLLTHVELYAEYYTHVESYAEYYTHVESYAEYYTNQEYGLIFWHRDEMNDLTDRICLSAVDTKHSTALFTATGLSQGWPTRIGELLCVKAYLTIFAGHAIEG